MLSTMHLQIHFAHLQHDLNRLADVAQRLLPVRDLGLKDHKELGRLSCTQQGGACSYKYEKVFGPASHMCKQCFLSKYFGILKLSIHTSLRKGTNK